MRTSRTPYDRSRSISGLGHAREPPFLKQFLKDGNRYAAPFHLMSGIPRVSNSR